MNWDIVDFTIFGGMVFGVILMYSLLRRKANSAAYRFGLGTALLTAFILVWVNGAVGIIGNEGDDANLLYFGVIGIAALGALIARFKPRGMAFALVATAIAQAAVAAYALFHKLGATGPIWPKDILLLTGFFVALWLTSAWLFGRAARRRFAAGTDLRG